MSRQRRKKLPKNKKYKTPKLIRHGDLRLKILAIAT